MSTNVIPTTGLEYTLVPDGTPLGAQIGDSASYPFPGSQTPYSWTGVNIGYSTSPPLNGYRIQTRYKVVNFIPGVAANPGDPNAVPPVPATDATTDTYTYTYPAWTLVSQTLTCSNRATETPGNPFETSAGNEYISPTPGAASIVTSGITDGMKYDYFKVFDETVIDHIEALQPYNSVPVEDKRVPTIPYQPDADPPVFPIDALTAFVPDERESVTVTYTLTTVWSGGTDVISINQVVTQNTENWKAVIKNLIKRSYYTHNLNPWKPDGRTPPDPTTGITEDGAPYYPGYEP